MTNTLSTIAADIQHWLAYPVHLGDTTLTLGGGVKLLMLLILVLIIERIVRRILINRVLSRTKMDPPIRFAIGRFAGYLVIALGFLLALNNVGINLSSLTVVASAVGIGLGFGLQNIVNNFFSGLIILAERPVAIGDRIEIGGVAGTVTKINMRSTVVVTNDNITIIVPNSDFISSPVTNWSHGDPKVRLRLAVGVAYGTDIAKLKKVLLDVANQNPSVLKDPAPSLIFCGFGDNSLNFELAAWTVNMAHNPNRFRSDLFFAIEQALRESQIEIPFPQRDLHIRTGELPVRLRSLNGNPKATA